jgi:hypothetical protein
MDSTYHAHPRRRGRFAALAGLAVLTASLGAGAISLAIFTDTDAVEGGPFSTGTIQIDASPATVAFTPQPMYPGDTVSGTINVDNVGTGDLRYAITSSYESGDALLAETLQLSIYAGATCTGPVLASGDLDSTTLGSPTQGDDAGDRDLAAGADEDLCFEVTLPGSVSDPALQGVSTTVTFTFDAEQTANN